MDSANNEEDIGVSIYDRNRSQLVFDQFKIEHTSEWIYMKSKNRWRTLSSAVLGAGFRWHHSFLNRHVDKDYHCDDPESEFKMYLHNNGVDSDTLAMMTAARLEDASMIRSRKGVPLIFVVISTGTSNAVDASRAFEQEEWKPTVGTINTWVFIVGQLPESAFVQAIMTATEAKVKALHDEKIYDTNSGTLATGTSTDSVMIASTQTGPCYPYAGTITEVGKEIARLVYEGTRMAIGRAKKRTGVNI